MNESERFAKTLSEKEAQALLSALQTRFEAHPQRHPGIDWAEVRASLDARPHKLWPLRAMEASGGEPDVIGKDPATGGLLFVDCSAETPPGRRNLCYDDAALNSRKTAKPEGSACGKAAAMGIRLLSEEEYLRLQSLGEFDLKTSSWLFTPEEVRKLGGALFGDRRYGRVFCYHNGAESYYGVRGFRGLLRV